MNLLQKVRPKGCLGSIYNGSSLGVWCLRDVVVFVGTETAAASLGRQATTQTVPLGDPHQVDRKEDG